MKANLLVMRKNLTEAINFIGWLITVGFITGITACIIIPFIHMMHILQFIADIV